MRPTDSGLPTHVAASGSQCQAIPKANDGHARCVVALATSRANVDRRAAALRCAIALEREFRVRPAPRCRSRASAYGRLLSLKPIVALGIASYGIYLWHFPIMVSIDALAGLDSAAAKIVSVVLTAAAVVASY